jgi:hypothetical protein
MSGEDDRENDPMAPEAWYSEKDVCGSCIAWRPEAPKEGDEVATGVCRLRPELARVPASLKLCNLYKPRGQFVYLPSKKAEPTRKRASAPKILRRSEEGELISAKPAPQVVYERREPPPEETYVPPREIDLGEDANLPAVRATFRDLIREELGNSRREMQKKFKGGVVKVAIRTGPYLEHPVDRLFTLLDRLKSSLDVLEEKLEKNAELKSEAEQVKRIRGSFTTFNFIWSDREDYFTGKE